MNPQFAELTDAREERARSKRDSKRRLSLAVHIPYLLVSVEKPDGKPFTGLTK
jgi:hypothetical protein